MCTLVSPHARGTNPDLVVFRVLNPNYIGVKLVHVNAQVSPDADTLSATCTPNANVDFLPYQQYRHWQWGGFQCQLAGTRQHELHVPFRVRLLSINRPELCYYNRYRL